MLLSSQRTEGRCQFINMKFILKEGMFITIGIAILIWGLYLLFEKGGWIIGTSQRLFIYETCGSGG